MNEATIRVVVADDHPLFRLGLTAVLTQRGFSVVGQAARGDEAVELVTRCEPQLVILDVRMPGLDGLEACRQITAMPRAPRVVMLSTYDEPAVLRAARDAGAAAFFGKETAPDEVADWCRRLVAEPGLNLVPSDVEVPTLSPRERDVLALLAQGHSNKAIAATLRLSPETVKDHLGRIYAKFGTSDRLTTVNRAHDLGFFAAGDNPP